MITVSGVSKQYGKHVVVDDMTFAVTAGRVTGFVGPNGAGKSTTMRMMVGLTRPDSGEVCYDGVRYTDLRHPAQVVGAVLDFVSSHLIGELHMFADDLVVVGAGKLLAAQSVAAMTARNGSGVVAIAPHAGELARLLARHGLAVERAGDRLTVRGTTTATVSQIAFDHRLRIVELTETSRSLEDSLLELTAPTAQFASA